MKEPLTEELLEELLSAPDAQSYVKRFEISGRNLSEYLEQFLAERGLRRIDVIHKAGLNETFGYQIFKGKRKCSRNKLLQLIFALELDLREANRLLKAGGANELYCKERRDAIIIFCLNRKYNLQETDEELYRFSETTICSEDL